MAPQSELDRSRCENWLFHEYVFQSSTGRTGGPGAKSHWRQGLGVFPAVTTCQESQIKGVWRLQFVNTCTPGEPAEVLMDYRLPLRDAVGVNGLSAELWREID